MKAASCHSAFFREASEGTYTDNMGNSENRAEGTGRDFGKGSMTGRINRPSTSIAMGWRHRDRDSAAAPAPPKINRKPQKLAVKKPPASLPHAEQCVQHWNNDRFLPDNEMSGIVAFAAQGCAANADFSMEGTMSSLKVTLGILAAGLMLGRLQSDDLRSDQRPEFQAA